jgi:hypothetical protein
MMMQRAAFILDVGDAMSMVAVTAGRAVVVGARDRRLAFEHVHGVVEHHRHDAGELGDQKQPEQPRAEAALRLQRRQWPPVDLDMPVKLGTLAPIAEPGWCVSLWHCCGPATDDARIGTGECVSTSPSPKAKCRASMPGELRCRCYGDAISAHTATRGLFTGIGLRQVADRSVGMIARFRLGPQ